MVKEEKQTQKETLGRKITNWGCVLFLASGILLPDIIDRQPTYNYDYNSLPNQEQPLGDLASLQETNNIFQVAYNLAEGSGD